MNVPSEYIRNKSDEVAIENGCYFDVRSAERVRYFFRTFLRHSKGRWQDQTFDLLPWQWERVVAPLYGWKRKDGTRRFRRCAIAVPKKNGKSTLLSGLGLYHLLGDREAGAEVYSAAADKTQAGIIFREAASMVKKSDALYKELRVVESGKRIHHDATNSFFAALSSDVNTKEGYNISCLLFDELHTQKTRQLWDALRYGGEAREQPLLIWISTAGFDKESLCYEEWSRARDVQHGLTIDTELLPVIFEPDEGDDWNDERTWIKCNPSYGDTIKPEDFRAAYNDSKGNALKENAFKRYRLNIWTEADVKWITNEAWVACCEPTTQLAKMEKCIFGLDLASTTDITAGTLLARRGKKFIEKPYFWVPDDAVGRRQKLNRTRLDAWIQRGLIKTTPGNVTDYEFIRVFINELADQYDIVEIVMDPWNASQFAVDLIGDGFKVEYCRTGFASITAAAKEYERLILAGDWVHDGNPVTTWMVNNLVVQQDASGNIKPDKDRASEKIDGPVSAMLALARFIKGVAGVKTSKYETTGLRTFGGRD